MQYNQLGTTGLHVSELCLGTMTFGELNSGPWKMIASVDQALADQMVEYAVDYGINVFDTSPSYSFGQAERILGQSLKNLTLKREDVVIATKYRWEPAKGAGDRGRIRTQLIDDVRASLDRMQTDYIDLYQLQDTDPFLPVDEILSALDELVAQGLVRHVGVSNWRAWRIAQAIGISKLNSHADIQTLQAYYSIAGRELEREIAPLVEETGLGLMVWSPLAGGLLSGKYGPGSDGESQGRRSEFDFPPVDKARAWDCIAELREVAARYETGVAEVALAYVRAKPFVTSVVIGARDLEQLEQNLGTIELDLDEEDMSVLDAVSALPEEYPDWMEGEALERVLEPFRVAG